MSKSLLSEPYNTLETQMISTFEAGCKEYGVDYPKSYSDMQAGMRALLRRYDIKFLPLDRKIEREYGE